MVVRVTAYSWLPVCLACPRKVLVILVFVILAAALEVRITFQSSQSAYMLDRAALIRQMVLPFCLGSEFSGASCPESILLKQRAFRSAQLFQSIH